MKIERNGEELIVKETPGCLWITGLFFALIGGIFVYGSLGGFSDYQGTPAWQLIVTCVMGLIAVAVGVWIIYRSPANEIVINQFDETILLKRFGLSGKTQQTFSFADITGFRVIEETDDENNLIWSLGIEKRDGETIKISSLPSHDEFYKRNFVFQINEFMRKEMPSASAFLELEDESPDKIS